MKHRRPSFASALAVLGSLLASAGAVVSAGEAAKPEAAKPETAQPPTPVRSPTPSRPQARLPVKRLEVTTQLARDRIQDVNIDIEVASPILAPGTVAACRAPVAVAVSMPELKLEMKTKTHATWYSLVDTIPPVGHRASVTVEPIRLISAGREVGTLTSGVVNFREVVRRVDSEKSKVAALLHQMTGLDGFSLQRLPALDIEPYTLPEPSVDVMRVELTETYMIDGVATDTVLLKGWIAVRHGAARAAEPGAPVSWDNSIVDTEFVGLDLHGKSDIFGPVHVTLDSSRPAVGEVGRIEIPEMASRILRESNARTAKLDQPWKILASTPLSVEAPTSAETEAQTP